MRVSRAERATNYVILAAFAVFALWPILGVVVAALGPDDAAGGTVGAGVLGLHPENFVTAWNQGRFGSYLRTSLLVSSTVVVVSVVFSLLAGYALGTMRFRGATVLFYVFLVGIMMPSEAVLVPLYYDLRALGLTDTIWALLLPQVAQSVAFGTFWMRAWFRSANRSVVEAARLDGASTWRILWQVLVPLARPRSSRSPCSPSCGRGTSSSSPSSWSSPSRCAPRRSAWRSSRGSTRRASPSSRPVPASSRPRGRALPVPAAPLHRRDARRSSPGVGQGIPHHRQGLGSTMTTHVSRPRASARRVATLATTVALALTGAGAAAATTSGDHHGGGHSSRPPTGTTSAGKPVDLGALFIGAHPDDEAGSLSAYGQWGHDNHLRTGVVTVTRGEGGGNAVGPEEGPPLGLLREKEERSAVGRAGITDIFNLDEVDFYYTVSDPLTQEVWDHDEVLGKVVRVIRETRPEILFTMDPAPSPGNHGNHQEAARLATEAFTAAGDPRRFPEQIRTEGLRPFSPDKLMMRGSATAPTGEQCMAQLAPKDPTQTVYGVWAGATSPDGRTWAAVERDAQRQYASQGWAGFPDVPTDPTKIGCDVFRQVDSRVPFAEPGTAAAQRSWSALAGSTVHAPGTVPLGTGLRVDTDRFGVLPGRSFKATVSVTAPGRALPNASVALDVPDGWP